MTVHVIFCDGETKIYPDIEDIEFVGNSTDCLRLIAKNDLQTLINWNKVKSVQYKAERIQILDLNMD